MKKGESKTTTSISTGAVAALIGVTAGRVSQMVKAGELTAESRGLITVESVARRLAAEREKIANRDTAAEIDLEKLRKLKADADLAEMAAAKEARRLVLASEVLGEWIRLIASMKSRLLSLPARLGPQVVILPGAQAATELIDLEMRAALQELADGENEKGIQNEDT